MTYSEIDGNKIWKDSDGLLHNHYGPAFIGIHGTEFWYKHGVLHCVSGPAISKPNGVKKWFIDGENFTENNFNKHMKIWAVKYLYPETISIKI